MKDFSSCRGRERVLERLFQRTNQRQGCGFPLMRWVAMFLLTTGAALQVSMSAFKTSELTLARAVSKCPLCRGV